MKTGSDTSNPNREGRVLVVNRRRWGLPATIIRGLFVLPIAAMFGGLLGGFLVYAQFARDLPAVDELRTIGASEVTRFYAADGQLAGEWYRERRIHLAWEQLPRKLVLAFLAAEDARFFKHQGVDLHSVARAMVQNFRAGGITSGASTITQQLAKTIVGTDKNIERKIREAILARRIEDVFSKKEILTRYLNSIYLGNHSYGVQAAAQNYFRKDVSALSLAEMAMLAGLPVAPSAKNPLVNMPAARNRMTYVLRQMERWGWASSEEVDTALLEEIVLKPRENPLYGLTPYFTELVRKGIRAKYATPDDPGAWLDRGLRVHMHVEPSFQSLARQALRTGLEDLARKQGYAGPLGHLEHDAFIDANERWLGNKPPEPEARLLGRVTSVERKKIDVQLGEGVHGTIRLKDVTWAGPYRALKGGGQGGARKKGTVSFKPKLRDMRKAFTIGDIILTDVKGGPPDALQLDLVAVPIVEGAVASAANHGGGIDVAVGGWDFDRSQLNRVESVRKTGSIIKPVFYSKAYDLQYAPSTMVSGAPFRSGDYNPTGNESDADLPIWEALTHSQKSASLRVLELVRRKTSLEEYQEWGRRLGLTRPLRGNPAEALGGDHTPLEMTRVFGTFARGGHTPEDHVVRKIVDKHGRVLERNISPADPYSTSQDALVSLWDSILKDRPEPVTETTTYLISANLLEVVQRGTATRAKKLGHLAAGKTGTLDYDVWFAGYTWARTAVVWLGSDRYERPLGFFGESGVVGGRFALPVWMDFMQRLDIDRPQRRIPMVDRPKDIDLVYIDRKTGLLGSKKDTLMPHILGTAPLDSSFEENSPENIEDQEGEF